MYSAEETKFALIFAVAIFGCLLLFLVLKLSRSNPRVFLLLLPLSLYFGSLAFPAIYVRSIESYYYGIYILLAGWLGVIGLLFGWYANLFFLLAFVGTLINKKSFALASSLAAAAVSLDSFRIFSEGLPNNGTSIEVVSFGIGAYMWFGAIFIMVPVALFVTKNAASNISVKRDAPQAARPLP